MPVVGATAAACAAVSVTPRLSKAAAADVNASLLATRTRKNMFKTLGKNGRD